MRIVPNLLHLQTVFYLMRSGSDIVSLTAPSTVSRCLERISRHTINVNNILDGGGPIGELPENWDQTKDDTQSLFLNKSDKNDLEPYPLALSEEGNDNGTIEKLIAYYVPTYTCMYVYLYEKGNRTSYLQVHLLWFYLKLLFLICALQVISLNFVFFGYLQKSWRALI